MKLLQRTRRQASDQGDDYDEERPLPDEAPEPQPERREPRLADPGLRDLSRQDYWAILRRAFKEFSNDHMTNIAAALAYYAFLAIPAALLLAVGIFSLVAGPPAVTTLVGEHSGLVPGMGRSLLHASHHTTVKHN